MNGGPGERADGGRVRRGEDGYTVPLPGDFFSRGAGTVCLVFFAARGCSLTIPLDSCSLELLGKKRVRSGLLKKIGGAVGSFRNKNADPFAPAPDDSRNQKTARETAVRGGSEILYAAPYGKKQAEGSREDPLDLQSAIRRCAPGGEVRLRAGRCLLCPLHAGDTGGEI